MANVQIILATERVQVYSYKGTRFSVEPVTSARGEWSKLTITYPHGLKRQVRLVSQVDPKGVVGTATSLVDARWANRKTWSSR